MQTATINPVRGHGRGRGGVNQARNQNQNPANNATNNTQNQQNKSIPPTDGPYLGCWRCGDLKHYHQSCPFLNSNAKSVTLLATQRHAASNIKLREQI